MLEMVVCDGGAKGYLIRCCEYGNVVVYSKGVGMSLYLQGALAGTSLIRKQKRMGKDLVRQLRVSSSTCAELWQEAAA